MTPETKTVRPRREGDRIQYRVDFGDEATNYYPVGTLITGVIKSISNMGCDVLWDDSRLVEGEIEYGIPDEILEPKQMNDDSTPYAVMYKAPGMSKPDYSYAFGVAGKEVDDELKALLSSADGAHKALKQAMEADGPRPGWKYYIRTPSGDLVRATS